MRTNTLEKPLNNLNVRNIASITKKYDPYDKLRNKDQMVGNTYNRLLYFISFLNRMEAFHDNYNDRMNEEKNIVEYTNHLIKLLKSQFRLGVTVEEMVTILEFADLDDFDIEMLYNIRKLMITKGVNYNTMTKLLLKEIKK